MNEYSIENLKSDCDHMRDSFRASRCQMFRESEQMRKVREELVSERRRVAKLEQEMYVANNRVGKVEENLERIAEEGKYD